MSEERVCSGCGAATPATAKFCPECGARLGQSPQTTEARKLVTLLFCDLVGSTALGERLDPEVFRQVQLRYFAVCEAALQRHLGVIEKFIGDAVLCVFGIPSAREDDALRACRAALDLVAGIDALNVDLEREWGVRLAVRIGVNSGVVAVGELSHGQVAVSGDPVNTAARLEQAAGAGEVLIGQTTRELVGDDATCAPVPPLELKGKGDGVPAWRLIATGAGVGGTSRAADAPFVDREAELERIRAWLDVTSANGGSCLVVGEAGVGKSRLVAHVVDTAGRRALWGRCPQYGEGIDYAPLVEWLDALGDDAVERAVGSDRAKHLQFVTGASDEPATTAEIEEAARALLGTLAADEGLLLVIDDVHLAEPAMLDLVDAIVGTPGVAVLAAGRQESLVSRPGLATGPTGLRVTVEPLGAGEAQNLLALIAPGLSDDLCSRVLERAAGNPFVIGQLARHVEEGGNPDELPASLDALLLARVESLSNEERAVAERGAVMGREFWDSGVAALAPDAAPPSTALTLLAGRSIVAEGRADGARDTAAPTLSRVFSAAARPYTFTSGLLRDAVYQATPKLRRADLHERLAGILEEGMSPDELVAFHLEQAARLRADLRPKEAEELAVRAASHLERAGERALAREDPETARALLTRAAALLGEGSPEREHVAASLALVDRGGGAELVPGDVIGGYRIRGVAGRGGMGIVYQADDLALGRRVALKVISPQFAGDARFRERFARESRIAAGLEHPNVVPVYGAGEENGQLYIAMRFVEGTDLQAMLRGGPLPTERAAAIVKQVGDALDAAHARGLVHRDVKPHNVLVAEVGGVEQAYLTDFGLTRDADAGDGLTKTGQWVGTLAYVAPEQIRGEPVDARADIYALGAVLYQSLTGQPPFPVETELEALAAHLDEPPPRPSRDGVPKAFDGIVERAMNKDPSRRFRSAGDLGRAAVVAVEGGKPRLRERSVAIGAAAPVDTGRRRHRRSRRASVLLGIAAAAVVAAVALGAAVAAGALSGGGGVPDNPAGRIVGEPIDLPYDPDHLAAGEGRVWALAATGNRLTRVDVASGEVEAFSAGVDLGGGAFPDLAVSPGAVWVAHAVEAGGVDHIDAETGQAVQHVPFSLATSVAVGGELVWAVAPRTPAKPGELIAIGLSTDRLSGATTRTGRDPAAVIFVAGSVWVANSAEDSIWRIDPSSRAVEAKVQVGGEPGLLASTGNHVWVANLGDNTLMRVDPVSNRVEGAPISLGKDIDDLAASETAVWVSAADGTVTRLDPATGEVVGSPITPARAPLSLAVDGGVVWVGSVAERTLTRIEEGGS